MGVDHTQCVPIPPAHPRWIVRLLIPVGFVIDRRPQIGLFHTRIPQLRLSATYPCDGTSSRRIQSRYTRRAADLSIVGRRVILRVRVRRFQCYAAPCRRRIFAERFAYEVFAPVPRGAGWQAGRDVCRNAS
jgi:hypothetical protein